MLRLREDSQPAARPPTAEDLLAAAAAESLERIRRDRRSSPVSVGRLLDYLSDHLFDPHLDVNRLKRACAVRDNAVQIRFHATLQQPPGRYIEDRRLETACRLLAETKLHVWQIAELVGYSGLQVFSRAFKRWSGTSPSSYRRNERTATLDDSRWIHARPDSGEPRNTFRPS